MRIFVALMGAAVVAMAGGVHAATAWPDISGVWQGTIGTAHIRTCIQGDDEITFGVYYYMRYLVPIYLDEAQPGDQARWTELGTPPAPDASWRFVSITADHLKGEWTGNGKVLPIDLTRVADDDHDMPCGSLAFNLPRYTKPVITTKPATLNGIAYTQVHVDIGAQFEDSAIETFQLAGTSPAIQHVNDALYASVPAGPDTADYFQCTIATLGQNGMDGGASSERKPVLLSKNWLVFEDDEGEECGGAHPNYETYFETWDLRAGAPVDLAGWLNAAAATRTVVNKGTANEYVDVSYTLPSLKLITAGYPPSDDDCGGIIDATEYWSPRLSPQGMVFVPGLSHAEQACFDDAVIPFDKLTPWLNAAGKAGVADFTAEVRPAPLEQ